MPKTKLASPDDDGQVTKEIKRLELKPIERQVIEVEIKGLSPLIPHKWSEKSLRQMREKHFGETARAKHEPKVPENEAEASLYYMEDGETPGMPATAFKAATVGAARFFSGVTIVSLKQALFVVGEGPDQLVPIHAEKQLREDTPRNSNGSPDLRYRYQLWPWKATLTVVYLPALVDAQSVVALVDAGGNGGVGDWRPSAPRSNTGTYGRFGVDTEEE